MNVFLCILLSIINCFPSIDANDDYTGDSNGHTLVTEQSTDQIQLQQNDCYALSKGQSEMHE